MALQEDLNRWVAAGLLAADQASRIRAYEMARTDTAPAERRGLEITATEVVAYLGAIVVLVGIGFLVATQYQPLGSVGRDLILGLVAAAALACGFFMDGRSERPAARRARAAGFFLGSLAVFALVTQVLVDARLLTRVAGDSYYSYDNVGGDVMAGAAAASLLAGALLWRTRTGLLAFAFASLVFTGVGGFEAWQFVATPDPLAGEAPYLLAAALLVAASEVVVRRSPGAWAAEILRFLAVLVPLVSALTFSTFGGEKMELLAGVLALAALGAALPRRSGGYVIAGGLGLFIVVMEVGFRHFAQTLGYPVVLIASGLLLLAIAIAMVRVLPRLRRGGRGSQLSGDRVDLGQEHG